MTCPEFIILGNDRQGLQIVVTAWGATWVSCQVPLLSGDRREVLLGCETLADYQRQTMYLGATIGRYSNRIFGAQIASESLKLAANEGGNQLHGGFHNLSQRFWMVNECTESRVVFATESKDGEEGYPGHLQVQVTYELKDNLILSISFEASVDKKCPLSLTNHAYFNLNGAKQKKLNGQDHYLQIAAVQYLSPGENGQLLPVEKSFFDFQKAKLAKSDDLPQGLDHAFLLTKNQQPALILESMVQDLRLAITTDLPSIQVYSGWGLKGAPARFLGEYDAFAGVALEAQYLPNSPNHPEWPQESCWYQKELLYKKTIHYQFVPQVK